jgi:hypothetical protein
VSLAGCAKEEETGKASPTATVAQTATPAATETPTALPATLTPVPLSPTPRPETPTPEAPTFEEIRADLESLRTKYPGAEKLFTSTIDLWDRAPVEKEAGDLTPASNDVYSVWKDLARAFNGMYQNFDPNMTCDPEFRAVADRVRQFHQAEFPPEMDQFIEDIGGWDFSKSIYGPGCSQ